MEGWRVHGGGCEPRCSHVSLHNEIKPVRCKEEEGEGGREGETEIVHTSFSQPGLEKQHSDPKLHIMYLMCCK